MTTAIAPATRPHALNSAIYRDTLAFCRQIGNAELAAFSDTLRYESADLPTLYGEESAEVAAILNEDRRRAVEAEIARRQRLYQAGRDVPNPNDVRYEQWRDVARQVRERSDIADIFTEAGYPLIRVGSNSRRGGDEYAGPCLLCGGDDRMRVWSGPNGRYWCRHCQLSGDVIAAAQTLLPACHAWHGAVAFLARTCGLATPDETAPPTPLPGRRVVREGVLSLA